MNLQQWSDLTGILPTSPSDKYKAVSVVIDQLNLNRSKLWNLSDYLVSSACGAVIWLTPKKVI